MSDESELARLRADLEVMLRYEPSTYSIAGAKAEIENRIDKLEAAVDPWRDVKSDIEEARKDPKHPSTKRLIAFIDHLTAENARLTARVADLEAEIKAEDDADVADAEAELAKEREA